jgi:hypothetical protein
VIPVDDEKATFKHVIGLKMEFTLLMGLRNTSGTLASAAQ